MSTIHVALQEGFFGDTVSIIANGKEVYYQPDLKTRMQIGQADTFELPVMEAVYQFHVTVVNLRTRLDFSVKPTGNDIYIGISLTPGKLLTHTISNEPFRYA